MPLRTRTFFFSGLSPRIWADLALPACDNPTGKGPGNVAICVRKSGASTYLHHDPQNLLQISSASTVRHLVLKADVVYCSLCCSPQDPTLDRKVSLQTKFIPENAGLDLESILLVAEHFKAKPLCSFCKNTILRIHRQEIVTTWPHPLFCEGN